MKKISKKERLQALKKIIDSRTIGNQIELQEELEKMKVAVTQATISRDLQELNMVKIAVGPGQHRYKIIEMAQKGYNREQLKRLFGEFVRDIAAAGNLLLVKTQVGNANSVAVGIDQSEFREILGTIAGDDTILVVTSSVKSRQKVEAEFRQLLR